MENAILVDGVGNTRAFQLKHAVPTVRLPIETKSVGLFSTTFSVVEFERLGSLPDGRLVYVQAGVGWKLWYAKAVVSHELTMARPDIAQQRLDDEIDYSIGALNALIVRRLYDVVTPDLSRGVNDRLVWGVGLPQYQS